MAEISHVESISSTIDGKRQAKSSGKMAKKHNFFACNKK